MLPGIVDDVVDMPDRTSWERVGNVPGSSLIHRSVDVNFIPGSIVEILAPVNRPLRNCGNVKGTRTARNDMCCPEFRRVRI